MSPTAVVPDPITLTGALQDTVFHLEPPGVLANTSAPVGVTLEVKAYSQPADNCGRVVVSPLGGLELTPAAGYSAECRFKLTTSDVGNGSITTTVAVVIGGCWAAPHFCCSTSAWVVEEAMVGKSSHCSEKNDHDDTASILTAQCSPHALLDAARLAIHCCMQVLRCCPLCCPRALTQPLQRPAQLPTAQLVRPAHPQCVPSATPATHCPTASVFRVRFFAYNHLQISFLFRSG